MYIFLLHYCICCSWVISLLSVFSKSITKDWGKRCEWEHPAAFGLGVIRASSQVFFFFSPDEEQWYFLLFLMELLQLSSSAYTRKEERVPARPCVCVCVYSLEGTHLHQSLNVGYGSSTFIRLAVLVYSWASQSQRQSQYLLEVSSAKVSCCVFSWSYYKPCHAVPVQSVLMLN